MKSARYAISRHIPIFFDTELRGLYRYDQVAMLPPETASKPEGWGQRRAPYGKYREIVAIRFGQYDLTVSSPNESPPLGQVTLAYPDGEVAGPLDQETWRRIGRLIRNREGISDAA